MQCQWKCLNLLTSLNVYIHIDGLANIVTHVARDSPLEIPCTYVVHIPISLLSQAMCFFNRDYRCVTDFSKLRYFRISENYATILNYI